MAFRIYKDEIRVTSLQKVEQILEKTAINLDFYELGRHEKVDLSKFTKLQWLGCDYKEIKNLDILQNLISLVLYSYSPTSKGLENLVNLEELVLRQGSLTDLSTISNLKNLINVEISYMNKLISIKDLTNCGKLQYLDIESCKNIKDLETTLMELTSIEQLRLVGVEINTISWIKNLKSLRMLTIIQSNILDGDLSHALNLEYAGFDNKRHYNYRYDELTKELVPKTKVHSIIRKNEKSASRTIVNLKYFGEINIDNLEMEYEADIKEDDLSIALDLNFENSTIKKSALKIVEKFLASNFHTLTKEIIHVLKIEINHESIVLYHEFIMDEFDQEPIIIDAFLESLFIKRVGFYPDSEEDIIVIDLQPENINSDHVLSLKLDRKLKIQDIAIES